MNKTIFTIIISLISFGCKLQNTINQDLKNELDSILIRDQIFREYIDVQTNELRKQEIAKRTGYSKEFLDHHILAIITATDSLNLVKVEKIISKYGYPGKSLVGQPTNTAAFLVIQHSPNIKKYYSLIEKAGKNKEIPFTDVAMMLDRKLIEEKKPQIYGTQLEGKFIINKQTGKKEQVIYVLPIKNAEKVNNRRKKAGFETTVEENAKRFGIEYKNYTYQEIERMK
ncbi:DUF6624 domain-containing protein [Pedobacter glucosidilyticus]|uniref:DUF6624 domain-containing protein n=1 Tax=Pedobacter glucosidilyticus TaxID=1122941 RepID=UPI0026F1F358|nr:DUF6624 domain-containing protein [Pedobacter glucosidilyticus]